MTAVQTPEPEARRGVSPVLVVMVLTSLYGAWGLYHEYDWVIEGFGSSGLLALLVWAVYGAVGVTLVWALQRFARRPLWTVALALAWGALATIWMAEQANQAAAAIFLRSSGSNPAPWLADPAIEECSKALGVVGLCLIPAVCRMRALDGLFYGVMIGIGFQVVEDATYTLSALFDDPAGGTDAIATNLVGRGFLVGLFTHAVFTGVTGAAIGSVAGAPRGQRRPRVFLAIGALLLMIAAHGLFNAQDGVDLITFATSASCLLLLLYLLHRSRRTEVDALVRAIEDNAGWGDAQVLDDARAMDSRPRDRAERRRHLRVLRYAWAADHLGPGSEAAERAAAALRRPTDRAPVTQRGS